MSRGSHAVFAGFVYHNIDLSGKEFHLISLDTNVTICPVTISTPKHSTSGHKSRSKDIVSVLGHEGKQKTEKMKPRPLPDLCRCLRQTSSSCFWLVSLSPRVSQLLQSLQSRLKVFWNREYNCRIKRNWSTAQGNHRSACFGGQRLIPDLDHRNWIKWTLSCTFHVPVEHIVVSMSTE